MKAIALLAAVLLLAACAGRAPLESQLKPIRTYGWQASVVDPAPEWRPGSQTILVRSLGGFSLLEEGGRGETRYPAENRSESHLPRWLNPDQFVYGPAYNARRGGDGTVTTPSEGLTVVTLGEGRAERTKLADRGYRPVPAGKGLVLAQEANRILFIDSRGQVEEFGEGFDAEPQYDGPGLCWRDTPAFETDWWTGRPGPGAMHVRWERGRVDDLGDAVQAAWTRHGEVLYTTRRGQPAAGQPWWAGGTDIMRLSGPGGEPVLVRRGAYDPQPHPVADLLAWSGDDGGVYIGTIRADGWSERVAEAGSRPRWSPDGLRLCWLAPPAKGSQIPSISVTVLAVR